MVLLLWNHGHIVILETIRIGLLCLISTHGQSFIVGAALNEYTGLFDKLAILGQPILIGY